MGTGGIASCLFSASRSCSAVQYTPHVVVIVQREDMLLVFIGDPVEWVGVDAASAGEAYFDGGGTLTHGAGGLAVLQGHLCSDHRVGHLFTGQLKNLKEALTATKHPHLPQLLSFHRRYSQASDPSPATPRHTCRRLVRRLSLASPPRGGRSTASRR